MRRRSSHDFNPSKTTATWHHWRCGNGFFGFNAQRIFAPAKDHIEMDFAIDEIKPVTFRARDVIFYFRRGVADFGDDRAALLRFRIDPRGDREPFAVIFRD